MGYINNFGYETEFKGEVVLTKIDRKHMPFMIGKFEVRNMHSNQDATLTEFRKYATDKKMSIKTILYPYGFLYYHRKKLFKKGKPDLWIKMISENQNLYLHLECFHPQNWNQIQQKYYNSHPSK